ncbi:Glutamate/Leucine/Phenylalanine/Valine dehydrogenase-domain-containing protein [Suillus subalutaceus]|uniref:Glutamate/Leucine/Phenylalanine/Valine dehydrogenase-domain-containing protein n=1 Tax=Suillus subalutaceus TaxID=48586 RepID=UPI001B868739|nr:Glutamate/Leucine/Phenylalanine/Valine dehydrogenase-domain-containing protein [Suillus subalutaceus]KAG1869058.1 Glutamate/Leucine/Phenylalanine/Valine dehydrogenase-domain-containing protein [Suillus subalutaceus]
MPLLNGHDSGAGTEVSLQRVRNLPGYTTPKFNGKDEQRAKVKVDVTAKGFIPRELVENEVDWFYSQLGIDDTYFQNESSSVISDHIIGLFGAKILAFTKHDFSKLVIDLEKIDENGNGATFIHTSLPGLTSTEGPGATCESRIDSLYFDKSTPSECYRLETYRSIGSVSATAAKQLRCYFITRCNFPSPPPSPTRADGHTDIRTVSDTAFLERASPHTLREYQKIMWQAESRYGPVMEVYEVEGTRERRLVIGYKTGGTSRFFSALSHLYHFYQLYSSRKYVEQFSNGITIISLHLNPMPNSTGAPIELSIFQVMKEASLLYCLPDNPFFRGSVHSGHAVQEATYAYCGWVFAQHFCNRLGPAYHHLRNILDESNPSHAEVLNDIKRRFREETFTRDSIAQVIHTHSEIVRCPFRSIRLLYVNFAMVHYPAADQTSRLRPTLSYQRLHTTQPLSDTELHDKIRRAVSNKQDLQVLESFLIFNKHVLKTNFYQPTKVALSFRLAPNFLPQGEYPTPLFGMFLVIGNEFRGFHIRFRDVARGGIRIVMSRNEENYMINKRMLFDENYGLAATQSLKNKDIPEGGAKGTILPSLGAPPRRCFEKYIDAIIDLLIPNHSSGIKERHVDLYGKEEWLFFGPDEGTADMMDWAALHARDRGAETWWKTFTTGKSAELLGGVPHDTYGMTSLSIRQYVLGIYKQFAMRETDITKVQTGGPDGDLGSNEILLSSDKTVAIIDGSGVLADPVGINRKELVRLAKLRLPVSHFDKTKLSKDGYLVKVEEQDVKLPSGEVVLDGNDFRNGAHFRFKADLFVPCGGRPEAVNISNVAALTDTEGKPHFKYIVEGANLFFTQQARLHLEKRRVVMFKDSSANKGGVTSSSLEVLAGLALTTQEYLDLMVFKDGKPSDFYRNYVKDIQAKIAENAAAEFHCIWQEHSRLQGAKPRTQISDELSIMLNELHTKLEHSDLFEDAPSRKGVMRRAIPTTLVKQVGLDTLLERLPESYQRALFSSWVSSHFIYKYGVNSSTIDFFHFARDLSRE